MVSRNLFVVIALLPALAFATDKGKPFQDQDQKQDQDQEQTQEQTQGQGQEQEQRQIQDATANNEGNVQKTSFISSGASSGDSTSTCQKVRDIRGADGWLFGIRWDMTDVDCRRLDLADRHYALGNTYFADSVTCSAKVVLDAFDGDAAACKSALEVNDVTEALRRQVKELERQKSILLSEREIEQARCEQSKDRIAEACRK